MKLSLVVLDLEMSSRVKRWALRVAIPAAILTGAGIAWATTLKSNWSTGAKLSAADLNANFGAAEQRLAGLESKVAGLEQLTPLTTVGTEVCVAADATKKGPECQADGSLADLCTIACRQCCQNRSYRHGWYGGDHISGSQYTCICLK